MFNLDQNISEWRRQMLAAGIKTPVPLEELEIHLREEIDQHVISGLNEEEAFQAAVKRIGQAGQIQKEFKKVEKGHAIIRAILLVIGWSLTSCMLCYSMLGWQFDWNFIHFSPRWNMQLVPAMTGICVALTATWFLAKASRDKTSRITALLFCVILVACSISCLPPEKITTPPIPALGSNMTSDEIVHYAWKIRIERALSRSAPSPFWYRGGRALLLCLPVAFCALSWRARRDPVVPEEREITKVEQ
jgi:hypothetical protein